MGIIDRIIRRIRRILFREAERQVEDAVVNAAEKKITKELNTASDNMNQTSRELNEATRNFEQASANLAAASYAAAYTIPAQYSMFPGLRAQCVNGSNKETDEYVRCTLDYINVTDDIAQAFIASIEQAGFARVNEVRWDYQTMYIIFERDGSNAHLVYHIKK